MAVDLVSYIENSETPLVIANSAAILALLFATALFYLKKMSPNRAMSLHVAVLSANLAFSNIYATLHGPRYKPSRYR